MREILAAFGARASFVCGSHRPSPAPVSVGAPCRSARRVEQRHRAPHSMNLRTALALRWCDRLEFGWLRRVDLPSTVRADSRWQTDRVVPIGRSNLRRSSNLSAGAIRVIHCAMSGFCCSRLCLTPAQPGPPDRSACVLFLASAVCSDR